MRNALFCIAFVVVALFPSIASAKESEGSPKGKAEQSPIDHQQMQKFIRHFDGNRDGQLDGTERLAVQSALEQIKQNPEFAKQLFKQIEQIQPESILKSKLEQKLEIPAKPRTLEEKILKYLDKDGDGVLTPEEKATAKFTKNPANKSGDEKADEDEDKKQGKKRPADGREGKNANPNPKDPKTKTRSSQNRGEKQPQQPPRDPGNGHGKSARHEKPNKKDLKTDAEKNKDRWNDKRATDDKQTDSRKPTEKKPHERTSRSKSEASQKHNKNGNANANEKLSGQNRGDGQKTTRSKSKTGSDSHQLVDGRGGSDRPGPSHKSSGPKNGR